MKIDKDYIESLREDYSNGILEEHNVLPDPMKQFEKWFSEAIAAWPKKYPKQNRRNISINVRMAANWAQ